MTALENAFSASNTQYYLTDTLQCWKVRFARPGGLKIWRNLYWKSVASQNVYSYEILFNVDAEEL